jgi:hypothetical protein
MSLIKQVGGILEAKRAKRWVTVLDADELLGAPKFEVEVGILSEKKFLQMVKPYEKAKTGKIDMTDDEQSEFRKTLLADCITAWKGMCNANAKRLCHKLFQNPELLPADAPSEWPFDYDDLMFIGENMNAVAFGRITEGAMDLEGFVREEMLKTKKSLISSQSSPAQS